MLWLGYGWSLSPTGAYAACLVPGVVTTPRGDGASEEWKGEVTGPFEAMFMGGDVVFLMSSYIVPSRGGSKKG